MILPVLLTRFCALEAIRSPARCSEVHLPRFLAPLVALLAGSGRWPVDGWARLLE